MTAATATTARTALDRRFRLVLAAAGISNLGDGLYQAALPLLVASITRDPALPAAFAGNTRGAGVMGRARGTAHPVERRPPLAN